MKKFFFFAAFVSLFCSITNAQNPIKIHQGAETLMYYTSAIDSITHDANGNFYVYKDGNSQAYKVAEVDSISLDNIENMLYTIPDEELNDWDEGIVLPNQMLLLNKIDTLASEHLAVIKYDENDTGISLKYDNEGKLLSVESSEKSFYFSYENQNVIVKGISSNGDIESFSYTIEQPYSSRAHRAQASNNNNALTSSYENLQNFLNKYADKLATSDTPYLRQFAEELRNLPENLMREGLVKGLSKLIGKKIPFLSDIIKYLDDNDKRRVALGNCYVSLQGITESNEQHYIKGTLQNLNELPNYGELNTELKYGILSRYVGSGTDMSTPTIYWNDNKWEWTTSYQSASSINISQELPKLSFGWYVFRSYEERMGVVRYCDYYRYFNPQLDDSPNYSIANVQSRYLGDNKIEVSFTCSFEPIRKDILLYQGIELRTKDGEKIVSFGAGNYTASVKKTFDASLFEKDYSNFVATLEIDAQFWYVPYAIGKTYYKDLEPKSVAYNEKPSITFTSASITGTQVTDYDEENDITRYETSFSFDMDVKGTFWFTNIQYQLYSTSWNNNWNMQTVSEDGTYTMNGYLEYSSNSDMSHTAYYQMFLNNGSTKSSSNSLIFGGAPGSPSVSIGGSPSYAPSKNAVKRSVSSNLAASSKFLSMKKN